MKLYLSIVHLALVACFAAVLAGCITDPVPETAGGEGLQVRMQVRAMGQTGAPTAGGLYESRLGTIDVLSFDQDGIFIYRAAAHAIDAGYTWFDIVLRKNQRELTQTLVVLANLSSEIEAFGLVAGETTVQQLQQGLQFSFAHRNDYADPPLDADKEFGQDRLLPMWGQSDPLVLLSDEEDIGTIYMLRSLATVTLTVDLDTTDPAQKDFKITTAVIYNAPAAGLAIPAAGNITAGTDPFTQEYDIKALTPTVPSTTYDKAYYTAPPDGSGFVSRIYIGEKKNSATGMEATDTWLVIGGEYDNSGEETWYRLPLIDIQDNVCDVLRNHNYIFTITKVTGPGSPDEENAVEDLDVTLEVKPWDPADIDDMADHIYLNVSAVETRINEHNMARIYFSSNARNVTIDALTSEGLKVADLFYGLDEDDDMNFHYDWLASTGEGEGYFDIMTDRDKPGIESGTVTEHKIYLAAGKLKREITVNVTTHSIFLNQGYVGAFWKNDQTGERVVSLVNTTVDNGSWTATVEYPDDAPYRDWILLEAGKSLDPKLWTDEQPSDAEDFQVVNGTHTISGTGNVFFRIGLTGPNPNPEKPRYAKINIKISTFLERQIFIRQGEADDYIMRPEDSNATNTVTTEWGGTADVPRPKAVKWSPYNLTAREFNTGSTDIYIQLNRQDGTASGNYGVFTDHPTQGGALFKFAGQAGTERYAYHPVLSNSTKANDYTSGFWDDIKADHETCPPGYRRPADGRTDGLSDQTAAGSEFRQSLFLEAFDNTNPNAKVGNFAWGNYADGYFDRLPIVTSKSSLSAVVNIEHSFTGYAGALFFNPFNYASMFLPAGGRTLLGNVSFRGTDVFLHTSSYGFYELSNEPQVLRGNFNSDHVIRILLDQPGYGFNIRCVVDEKSDPIDDAVENRLAKSNIIVMPDGTLKFATTYEENAEIPANVMGVLFKFGSLIGTNSDTDFAQFTSWDPSHVVFVPEGNGTTYTQNYNIPYFDSTTGVSQTEDDFWNTWPGVGFDAAAGLGDICRYITSKNWVEGKWRLPRLNEIWEITYLGYTAVGVWSYDAFINENGPGTAPVNTGFFVGGSDTGPINQPNEGIVYLPASGQRSHAMGQYQNYGLQGYYWSCTLQDPQLEYAQYLHLMSDYLYTAAQPVTFARSVRCIREKEGE